jgi:tubulin gamma
MEHGIDKDGMLEDLSADGSYRKSAFFYQADGEHYIPGAILVDLEPGVRSSTVSVGMGLRGTQAINNILSSPYARLYNPENIFKSKDGGGAGNNWAQGYSSGEGIYEDLMEMIDHEVEGSESLEVRGKNAMLPSQRIILLEQAFLGMHSIAGGTGSGLGSSSGASHGLKRLVKDADSVFVLDNAAFAKIASDTLHIQTPSFDQTKQFAATVVGASRKRSDFLVLYIMISLAWWRRWFQHLAATSLSPHTRLLRGIKLRRYCMSVFLLGWPVLTN